MVSSHPAGVPAEVLHRMSLAVWWGGKPRRRVHCLGGPRAAASDTWASCADFAADLRTLGSEL